MGEWAKRAEAVLGEDEPDEDEGELFVSALPNGHGSIRGDLNPECRALVQAALRLATTQDRDGEPKRTPGQRRHDAIADVCKHFLDHQTDRTGGSHRPHLNILMTNEELVERRGATDSEGGLIDAVTMSAIRCDCTIHRLLIDSENNQVDVGRATNTISADMRIALIARDGGCRFPGCDRPPTWCDAHHVHWWRHQCRTDRDNLVLLCWHHHRAIHKHGWQIIGNATNAQFIQPDGQHATEIVPMPAAVGAPIADQNRLRRLGINPNTIIPTLDGQPPDYADAVAGLHWLEQQQPAA